MKWEGEIDRARSWDWKCIECKECEICHEKGDDVRTFRSQPASIPTDARSRTGFYSATPVIVVGTWIV
jgi:hypothetical protein